MANSNVSVNYTREKFLQAADALAADAPIRRRLASAAQYLIRLEGGNGRAFRDPAAQERFEKLMHLLTDSTPSRENEGTIASSTAALSDEHASHAGAEILALYADAIEQDFRRD